MGKTRKDHKPALGRRGRRRVRLAWPAIFFASGLAVERPSQGATIRDDTNVTPDSAYQTLAANSAYASSGYLTVSLGGTQYNFGSATLIAPDWVLTAAINVTQNTSGTPAYAASLIQFGQGATAAIPANNSVAQVVVAPGWNYDLTTADDLALVRLSTPITSVAPATVYSNSLGAELGQTATIIGYGMTGTGLTGDTQPLGTRRGIQNTLDAVGGSVTGGGNNTQYSFAGLSSSLLLTDFDEPSTPTASLMGSTTPGTYEGASAVGDSGGGMFLTVNSQTYLAGVTHITGAFPNNPLSTAADGHYGDYSAYTNLTASTSMSFIDSTLATASAWTSTGSGSWVSPSAWSGGIIPEFAGATANFAGAINSPATVNLNTNWTVGTITFNNAHTYTIAAGTSGALTLDNGGATTTASIVDSSGTHIISAPVRLNSSLNVSVTNPGDTLEITGNISDNAGGGGLTLSGSGTLFLAGANTYASTTIKSGTLVAASLHAIPAGENISNNAIAVFASGTTAAPTVIGTINGTGTLDVGTSSTSGYLQLQAGSGRSAQAGLSIAASSTLDITNNVLTINYPAGNDPASSLRGYLTSGYSGDTWTGAGIVSSNAAANPGLYAVGYADGNTDVGTPAAANQIYIENTLAGDANLDGVVNFPDLLVVAQNYGKTGQDWGHGDFNYDGIVNFPDLLLIAQNYGKVLSAGQLSQLPTSFSAEWQLAETEMQLAAGNVPEPAVVNLVAAAMIGVFMRRRRSAVGL